MSKPLTLNSDQTTTPAPQSARPTKELTLYTNPGSLYSAMVRLAFAFVPHSERAARSCQATEHTLDLQTGEQMEEWYLKVHSDGTVPALDGGELSQPLPGSVAILRWLAKQVPALLPAAHETETWALIERIQTVPFFVITRGVQRGLAAASAARETLQERMDSPDASDSYRQLLANKQATTERTKNAFLEEGALKAAVQSLGSQLNTLSTLRNRNAAKGPYLFGDTPSVLDAVVAPVLIRCRSVAANGQTPGVDDDFVPRPLRKWLEIIESSPAWQEEAWQGFS